MHKAQVTAGTNPINAAASILSERLKSDGIILDKDALIDLEKEARILLRSLVVIQKY